MIQQTTQGGLFIQQLRDCLRRESGASRNINIARHENVYNCGDQGDTVYFVESGQMKLVMVSAEGKECIFGIHGAGEIFGELSLSGTSERIETAKAMEDTRLKVISTSRFFALLASNSLLEGFVRYLSVRIAEQQEVITQMVTADGEHRLGTTLLDLARKLGKKENRGMTIEHKISQEELSHMVGTTRPRITHFMQRFRDLGLVELSEPHYLLVKDKELGDYLTQLAS